MRRKRWEDLGERVAVWLCAQWGGRAEELKS
jgi:hypothetical protein